MPPKAEQMSSALWQEFFLLRAAVPSDVKQFAEVLQSRCLGRDGTLAVCPRAGDVPAAPKQL